MFIVRQERTVYVINERLHHQRKNTIMLLKTKAVWSALAVIVALCISSCSPSSGLAEPKEVNTVTPAQPALNTAETSQPVLKTSLGDFLIPSARLVDEVHDQKSRSGEKFLLVVLTSSDLKNLDPGKFSLDAFQKMIQDSNGQIYVAGKDNSQFISTMAGWIEDEFTMGFTVPILETYTLHWLGNSPIELSPKGQ